MHIDIKEILEQEQRGQLNKTETSGRIDVAEILGGRYDETAEIAEAVPEPEPAKEAPAVEPEPVVEDSPVVSEEPVIEDSPVISEEPAVEPEQVIEEEPEAPEAPAVEPEPVISEEPVVESEQVTDEETEAPEVPATEPEQVPIEEPAVEPEQVTDEEPEAPEPEPEPVISEEPVVESKQVTEEEPVVEEAPVISEEPAVEPERVIDEELEAPEVPATEPEQVPIEEPVIEETPVISEEPVVESKQVTEEEPIVEEAPVTEPEPVISEEPAPEPEPVPTEEPVAERAIEEPAPEPEPSGRGHFARYGAVYGNILLMALLVAFTIVYTTMTPRTIHATINGEDKDLTSTKFTVVKALEEQGLEYCEDDYLSVAPQAYVRDGMKIELVHAKDFTVTADGKTRNFKSLEETVGAALKDKGIRVGKIDIVEPKPDKKLKDGAEIVVKRVVIKEETVEEAVDFETVTEDDPSMAEGKTKVKTEGRKGKDRVVYKITYTDGKETKRKELSRENIEKPVSEVVAKGTAVEYNGKMYSRRMTVKAYSYTGGGRTAMGTRARVGEIAVDPRVIPLGTTVYIPGIGERRAEDTGGNIKGKTIDIYMNSKSACRRWGRRTITIYLE